MRLSAVICGDFEVGPEFFQLFDESFRVGFGDVGAVYIVSISASPAIFSTVASAASEMDALFATIFLLQMPIMSPSLTEKPFIRVERTAWVTSAVRSSENAPDIAV